MNVIRNICLLIVLMVGLNANEFKVVLADYKPYSWLDKEGNVKGIEIDILNEAIGKRLNIPIKIYILPWKRAQNYVKDGQADAFIAVSTKQRASYTKRNEEKFLYWGVSLFSNKTNFHFESLKEVQKVASLKPFLLGSMIGNGWSEKNLANMNVHWVNSMNQLLMILEKNRIDALADSPLVIKYHLKDVYFKNTIIELKRFLELPMYLSVSKKSPFLWILPKFDETIKTMKEDGTLDKILNKYQ